MNKKKSKLILILAWVVVVPVFVAGQVSFWESVTKKVNAQEASSLSNDIQDVQKKLDKTTAALAKDQANLGKIQQSVGITQKKISTTKAVITDTVTNLSRKEQEINNLNDQIKLQQELLKNFLQQAYYIQNKPILSIVLSDGNLADLLSSNEHFSTLDEKIVGIIADINSKKVQVDQDKVQLAEAKQQHEKVLSATVVQQQGLLADQSQVQSDIQDKAKTIAQLQGELDKLQSQYSAVLGKSISTTDIVAAAKFAAGATNINKSFLLGVLVQESNKGQNVGGCNYKTSRMPAAQLTAFKTITKELGYDYTKQKVSCPSNAYKGTGGAMGVPQFMPTTWLGYKSTIASLSGHNPPDPWNLVDGVVAMASKLSNDGADSKKRFDEAKSYCVYLAGGNWGSYCYGSASKYKSDYSDVNCSGSSIHNYGEKVLCLKDNYDKYY